MRQLFLDTETTGLSAVSGDRVLEIGCVEMVDRKLTDYNWHHYINPERDSHPDALKVHGITTEFLQDKPKFSELADEFLDYIAGSELIIHNASFDVGFLDAELARLGKPPLREHVSKITDTLAMAKEMFPGKRNSLDALCTRFEVDRSARVLHGALMDAQLLSQVYIHLTRGQNALAIDVQDGDDLKISTHTVQQDWSAVLRVLPANATELQAHEQILQDINKTSGGKAIWMVYNQGLSNEASVT